MSSDCNKTSAAAKLRDTLKARGVTPAFATRLADALLPRLAGLGADETQALIEGVEVSCRIYSGAPFEEPIGASPELENLFCDIADEIRKLDESVQMLASYAIQIRHRLEGSGDEALH